MVKIDGAELLSLKDGYVLLMPHHPLIDHERPRRSLVIDHSEMPDVLRALKRSELSLGAEQELTREEFWWMMGQI